VCVCVCVDSVHKGVFGGGGGDKSSRARGTKDKADRATTEQVLDPRTRLVLYKLLNKETLNSIHGCVSTGKD
jgi:RIO kinase 1